MEYGKKPVVVEAFQLEHRGMVDAEWFWDAVSENEIVIYNFGKQDLEPAYCEIKTSEGIMRSETGDYLIKGIQGEIYTCPPNIFEAIYEACEERFRPEVSE